MKIQIHNPLENIEGLTHALSMIPAEDLVYVYPYSYQSFITVSNEELADQPSEFIVNAIQREHLTSFDLSYMIDAALNYLPEIDLESNTDEEFFNSVIDQENNRIEASFKHRAGQEKAGIPDKTLCVAAGGLSQRVGVTYAELDEAFYKNKVPY